MYSWCRDTSSRSCRSAAASRRSTCARTAREVALLAQEGRAHLSEVVFRTPQRLLLGEARLDLLQLELAHQRHLVGALLQRAHQLAQLLELARVVLRLSGQRPRRRARQVCRLLLLREFGAHCRQLLELRGHLLLQGARVARGHRGLQVGAEARVLRLQRKLAPLRLCQLLRPLVQARFQCGAGGRRGL